MAQCCGNVRFHTFRSHYWKLHRYSMHLVSLLNCLVLLPLCFTQVMSGVVGDSGSEFVCTGDDDDAAVLAWQCRSGPAPGLIVERVEADALQEWCAVAGVVAASAANTAPRFAGLAGSTRGAATGSNCGSAAGISINHVRERTNSALVFAIICPFLIQAGTPMPR